MYVPSYFAQTDAGVLHQLMRRYGFATLVTVSDGAPFASHLPLLVDVERGPHGTLLGHVARANPQWRSFGEAEALAIFQGPHAYVSPSWYAGGPNVPTWNYAVVHAYGVPRLVEERAAARAVIERLVTTYEGGRVVPWETASLAGDFVDGLMKAIVVFEVPIARLEGKYKLSQNKSAEDRRGVVAGLRAEGGPESVEVARLMSAAES